MQPIPRFEIVTTTTGATSIRNTEFDEIMHNPVGPWAEANSLYIDQSNLKVKLSESSNDEIVIFDVGLGAAANALAAMACSRSLLTPRPLRIISFERDLDLLKFALAHANAFTHFKGFEFAIQKIIECGKCYFEKITWELRQGNFLETIDSERFSPHIVFFDPYSPNVNQEMWTIDCFKKIRKLAQETCLYTYSRATHIRVALINAGFFVGYGKPTGLKPETTEAATDLSMLKSPLDKVWFERWSRSHVRYPFDCAQDQQKSVDKCVAEYFSKLT